MISYNGLEKMLKQKIEKTSKEEISELKNNEKIIIRDPRTASITYFAKVEVLRGKCTGVFRTPFLM